MLDGICLSLSLEIVLAIFGIYVPNMQDGDVYVTARTTVKWFLPLQYKFLTVAFEMVKCAECNMHHPLSYVDLNFLQKDVTTHILMRKKNKNEFNLYFLVETTISKPWRGRDTDEPEFSLHFADLISFLVVAVSGHELTADISSALRLIMGDGKIDSGMERPFCQKVKLINIAITVKKGHTQYYSHSVRFFLLFYLFLFPFSPVFPQIAII